MQKKFTINSLAFLRVGNKRDIEEQFSRSELTFSCAANWISYAYKFLMEGKPLNGTTDIFDCAFACQRQDFRDDKLLEKYKSNLIRIGIGDKKYYYFNPVITMPAICFYNINSNILEQYEVLKGRIIDFPLNEYAKVFDIREAAFLLISDVESFGKELRRELPRSIIRQKEKFTCDGFTYKFDEKSPYIIGNILYEDRQKNPIFYNEADYFEPMFRKDCRYKWQNEVRIVVPNISFRHSFGANYEEKCYKNNLLSVSLPCMHDYARILHVTDRLTVRSEAIYI